MRPARLAVTLTAHGSRDPRAARATEALTRAVAVGHPEWEVRASYLDHAGPRPREVLTAFAEAGHQRAVLVPLLLTAAYHGRVDVPGEIAAARAEQPGLVVEQADVLGPVDGRVPELLLDALVSRLGSALPLGGVAVSPSTGLAASPSTGLAASPSTGLAASPSTAPTDSFLASPDALVLAAAGTRNAAARGTVEETAAALGARLGVPCRVAYASAAPPLSGDVVRDLRAEGHERIALVSYFLAPGLLWDSTLASAREAGISAVAEPLTDIPAIAELVSARVREAAARRVAALAA
jgi:sirohydrochlorin ferrochelatase